MKADKIFWGIIFVFVGGVFLLENFGYIDFRWGYIWHFWPLLLVITGINIIFSKSQSKVGVIAIAVITVLALGFLTIKGLEKRTDSDNKNNWSWNFSDDDKNDGWDNGDSSNVDSSNYSGNTSYSEDYDSNYQFAKLNIRGGASNFEIRSGSDKLFESKINKSRNRYYLKKTETDSLVTLDFNSKNRNGNFNLKDDDFGDVKMKLNNSPIWEVSLHMGAGKADFDFSENKVKDVYLKGGAAEFDIKMGDLYDDVNVSAETGVAAVEIRVPENVGCEIKTSTGLSSKDFRNFIKRGDGSYETSNFKNATKKIYITLKGGLSKFEVSRY